jgi:hypothetical protein
MDRMSGVTRRSFIASALTASMVITSRSIVTAAQPASAELREDASVLLGHYVTSLSIDDVVIAGEDALITWRSHWNAGMATFGWRSSRWWLIDVFDTYSPAIGRDVAQLERELSITPALADRAMERIPSLLKRLPIRRQAYQPACAGCLSTLWDCHDRFEAMLTFSPIAPYWDAGFALIGSSPAPSEMESSRDVQFTFGLTTAGKEPIHMHEGATLYVWFPFVLQPAKAYELRIDNVVPNMGERLGVLHDNTLRFTLPAFSTSPERDAVGCIFGKEEKGLR